MLAGTVANRFSSFSRWARGGGQGLLFTHRQQANQHNFFRPRTFRIFRSIPVRFHSFIFSQLLSRSHIPGVTPHKRRIFRSCTSSVNNNETTPFIPATQSVRDLTRCLPHNITGEKGMVGSTCCVSGALRPGADCDMAVKLCLNRSTGDHLHFLLTKLSSAEEVSGTLYIEKLTAGVVTCIPRRLPLQMNHFFYVLCWLRAASPDLRRRNFHEAASSAEFSASSIRGLRRVYQRQHFFVQQHLAYLQHEPTFCFHLCAPDPCNHILFRH